MISLIMKVVVYDNTTGQGEGQTELGQSCVFKYESRQNLQTVKSTYMNMDM